MLLNRPFKTCSLITFQASGKDKHDKTIEPATLDQPLVPFSSPFCLPFNGASSGKFLSVLFRARTVCLAFSSPSCQPTLFLYKSPLERSKYSYLSLLDISFSSHVRRLGVAWMHNSASRSSFTLIPTCSSFVHILISTAIFSPLFASLFSYS